MPTVVGIPSMELTSGAQTHAPYVLLQLRHGTTAHISTTNVFTEQADDPNTLLCYHMGRY
jgi:hypothetical protein